MLVNEAGYLELQKNLTEQGVQCVAVSKTKPNEAILELYALGHRVFGENYVQELVDKAAQLPKDIQWHFIGHLQTNKVKYIAPFVSLIHGVDSEKLLIEINKQAGKLGRVIDCLLQVHIATEETKFGFDALSLHELLSSGRLDQYAHIKIVGLMGMASFVNNETQVSQEFDFLKKLFSQSKAILGSTFNILSMGMSGDYKLAIKAGSTMVRIGSLIFGSRNT